MKTTVLVGATLLAFAGGVFYWQLANQSEPVPPAIEGSAPIRKGLPPERAVVLPQPTTGIEVASRVVHHAPVAEDQWSRVLASDDPYPAMMQLRAARQPGSFAKAHEIRNACLEASLALRSQGTPPLEPNQPNYSARLRAKEVLSKRCSRFDEKSTVDTGPLADDVNGLNYMEATAAHRSSSILLDSAQFKTTVQELARQGRLDQAIDWLPLAKKWNGESWADAPEALGTALMLAKLKATSEPGMAERDIRLYLKCYRGGLCAKDYDDFLINVPENQRQRVLKTADEMAAIFRTNDYNKLFQAIGVKP
jgi:hypothetical protein